QSMSGTVRVTLAISLSPLWSPALLGADAWVWETLLDDEGANHPGLLVRRYGADDRVHARAGRLERDLGGATTFCGDVGSRDAEGRPVVQGGVRVSKLDAQDLAGPGDD